MFYVKPVSQVLKECRALIDPKSKVIRINIERSLGKILAEDIEANENIPGFARSTVDGFALKAEDTFGSSENMPSFLEVTNEILMGKEATITLNIGQAQKIATGGMLPPGSNAVVMQEYTEQLDTMLSIYKSISPGENVIQLGEDIKISQIIFTRGHRIRPQDIGILAAMGINMISIIEPLAIAILSTGDELVEPKTKPLMHGQVRDTNGYSVTAFLEQKNYKVDYHGIIKDNYEVLHQKVHDLYSQYDVVIVSGGSSVGTKDVTSDIIGTLPNTMIVVHGVAIKPGKPTIVALSKDKMIIGLPGHPVSALVVMQHVIDPLLSMLQGIPKKQYKPTIKAHIEQNIDSQTGRTDIVRVRFKEKSIKEEDIVNLDVNKPIAVEPLLSKSGVFSSLVKADGYIVIAESVEGIMKGSMVDVYIYE